jgi:hypothetical protein
MPNTPQNYCEEFCDSLHPDEYGTGNWFGRLLAFRFRWDNFVDGKSYTEEEFRDKIKDGSIEIQDISLDNSSITYPSPTSVKGKMQIQVTVDGQVYNDEYEFIHELVQTLHSGSTRFV